MESLSLVSESPTQTKIGVGLHKCHITRLFSSFERHLRIGKSILCKATRSVLPATWRDWHNLPLFSHSPLPSLFATASFIAWTRFLQNREMGMIFSPLPSLFATALLCAVQVAAWSYKRLDPTRLNFPLTTTLHKRAQSLGAPIVQTLFSINDLRRPTLPNSKLFPIFSPFSEGV